MQTISLIEFMDVAVEVAEAAEYLIHVAPVPVKKRGTGFLVKMLEPGTWLLTSAWRNKRWEIAYRQIVKNETAAKGVWTDAEVKRYISPDELYETFSTLTKLAIDNHKSVNAAFVWIGTKQDYFLGKSPAEVVMSGDEDILFDFFKKGEGHQ